MHNHTRKLYLRNRRITNLNIDVNVSKLNLFPYRKFSLEQSLTKDPYVLLNVDREMSLKEVK